MHCMASSRPPPPLSPNSHPSPRPSAQRKSDAKASKAAGEAKAKEEATWAAHANPVNKRDVKREEQERKAADAAARKAEARRLLAEEEAALSRKKEAVPKAYYARRLEEMKADKPGLRLMQYKSKVGAEGDGRGGLVCARGWGWPSSDSSASSLPPPIFLFPKIFDEWQRSPLNPRNQAPKE
eukprot:scaffold1.g5818.t1